MEKLPPRDRYRWVGFDECLGRGDPRVLRDAIGGLDVPTAERVASYLHSGVLVAAFEEENADVFDIDIELPPSEILSDGEWVWHCNTEYYVKKYRAALGLEFVAKALSKGLVDPAEVNAQELEDWISGYFCR